MYSACLAVLASLCLNDSVAVEVNHWGLGLNYRITSNRYEATLEASSDFLQTPDWRRMEEACWHDGCVAYYKHCVRAKGVTCTYWYSRPGDPQNQALSISADTEEDVKFAEERFAVFNRVDANTSPIPLKRFSEEGSDPAPPYCGRHASQLACWPSPE